MLETPKERVTLLKAGFSGKAIEKLYLEYNNFKIVRIPSCIELVEGDIPPDEPTREGCQAEVPCT